MDPAAICATKSGVVTKIAYNHLIAAAKEGDCVLEMVPALGEFVPAGSELFVIRGEPNRVDRERVLSAVILDLERNLEQDVAYGIRLLVDMGIRALADGPWLDPTTAVQAVDRIHDCLRELARRSFHDGCHHDDAGDLRLVERVSTCDDNVHQAFVELRLAGRARPRSPADCAAPEDLRNRSGRADRRRGRSTLEEAIEAAYHDPWTSIWPATRRAVWSGGSRRRRIGQPMTRPASNGLERRRKGQTPPKWGFVRSGRRDLNPRPLDPSQLLPSCATAREASVASVPPQRTPALVPSPLWNCPAQVGCRPIVCIEVILRRWVAVVAALCVMSTASAASDWGSLHVSPTHLRLGDRMAVERDHCGCNPPANDRSAPMTW